MQTALLDTIFEQMGDGGADSNAIGKALSALVSGLHRIRDAMVPVDWRRYVAAARHHPLVHLLHQDPFTCRCFCKPRGYAGDAKMIDFIYGYLDDDLHVT